MSRQNITDDKIWASDTDPTALDPQIEEPSIPTYSTGWVGGASATPPRADYENFWHNRADQNQQVILSTAVMPWDATQVYTSAGSLVSQYVVSRTIIYSLITATSSGNAPQSNPGTWAVYYDPQAPTTPPGTIAMWATVAAPLGWLICNGQTTVSYQTLRNVIGDNVPDLRGYFVRGQGGDSGALGATQAYQNADHNHPASVEPNHQHEGWGESYPASEHGWPWGNSPTAGHRGTGATDTNNYYYNVSPAGAHSHVIGQEGGNEARPMNVALNYIIKY